jgi:hypothetical protein
VRQPSGPRPCTEAPCLTRRDIGFETVRHPGLPGQRETAGHETSGRSARNRRHGDKDRVPTGSCARHRYPQDRNPGLPRPGCKLSSRGTATPYSAFQDRIQKAPLMSKAESVLQWRRFEVNITMLFAFMPGQSLRAHSVASRPHPSSGRDKVEPPIPRSTACTRSRRSRSRNSMQTKA